MNKYESLIFLCNYIQAQNSVVPAGSQFKALNLPDLCTTDCDTFSKSNSDSQENNNY